MLFISLFFFLYIIGLPSYANEKCGLNAGSFGKVDSWFRVYYNANSCSKVSGLKAKVYFRLEQYGFTVATSKVYKVSRRNNVKKRLFGEMADLDSSVSANLSLFMYAMHSNGRWKMVERHNNIVLIPN